MDCDVRDSDVRASDVRDSDVRDSDVRVSDVRDLIILIITNIVPLLYFYCLK